MPSLKPATDIQWMISNAKCWVEISESEFIPAIIISVDIPKKIAKLKYTSESKGPEEISIDILLQRNEDKQETYDDMVNLECLNDAELLINLQKRFEKKLIFTYVGPTLLVVNPYQLFPELFNPETLSNYQKIVFNPQIQIKDNPPHVWALAADAYRLLFECQKNQALVISGESGAGKTENTKYAMKFLTGLGKIEKRKSLARKSLMGGFERESIEDKVKWIKIISKKCIKLLEREENGGIRSIMSNDTILSCNPILEAFGNAKTVRNDNSSRFGKYVRLLVDKRNRTIIGARMDNYLLEKSRITTQGKGERNYHIFYHLMKGANLEDLESLGLAKSGKKIEMKSFEYLKKSECYDVPKIKDEILYKEVKDSFSTMKFTSEEENAIWAIVASCLHIGNINFDDSTFDNDKPCTIKNGDYLQTVAKLLKIDYQRLTKSILLKIREMGKNVIESPMTKQDCEYAKDSFAKDLFEKLFNWLVKRLNFTIIPQSDLDPNADFEKLNSERYAVGLLDIFGFECFALNSLEQFCINYTNEKLQQLYISYVFKAEEKEFINEELEKFICDLNFKDNQVVIDLMDLHPTGIYHLIDEICAVNGTDDNLVNKIRTAHKLNAKFQIPKLTKDTFIVLHTAKNVEYNINGFRSKNKDELTKIVTEAIYSSSFPEIVKIFKGVTSKFVKEDTPNEEQPKNKKNTDKYLGAKFRLQMKELMTELLSCDCHFIRCIKPNEQIKKDFWVPSLALAQIRYLGVLDSIKVRRDSFPIRRVYRIFYQKYGEMDTQKYSLSKLIEMKANFKELTINMMKSLFPNLGTNLVLFGKTKIFLRNPAQITIDQKFAEKLKEKNIMAFKIQKALYRFVQLKKLRRILKGIRRIQNLWRCRAEYKKFIQTKKKIRFIQRWMHKKYLKMQAKLYRNSCISIQNYFRRHFEFYHYEMIKIQIVEIQRLIRGGLARIRVRKLRFIRKIIINRIIFPAWDYLINSKAIVIQKIGRGYLAKCKNYEIVTRARKIKILLMRNKGASKIQKNWKGFIVRKRLDRLNKAAFHIQGYFRMRWLSAMLINLRKSSMIIQRNVRLYLTRKKVIGERIAEFLNDQKINFEKFKEKEFSQLFKENESNLIKEPVPFNNKIQLITFIFDLEIMSDTSDIYPTTWSSSYKSLLLSSLNSDSEIQCIKIGGLHSLAISNNANKVYSWGWNEKFQLGRDASSNTYTPSLVLFPYSPFKIKCCDIGEDHNLIIDYENQLWVWGGNNKGQLGLGNKENVIFPIKNENFPKNIKLKSAKARYNTSATVSDCGKVFFWPIEKDNEFYTKPIELLFPYKTYITSVSLGFNFSIFLTNAGLVYTMGIENCEGQLGHGDLKIRNSPTLIESLRNSGDKITSVECGFKHSIAKSSLGKIFTWGWGLYGQLGHGTFSNEMSPRILTARCFKGKTLQVQAGWKCSLLLMENKKIFWWGTNGTLIKSSNPSEFNLEKKNFPLSSNECSPIRIMSSWSKSMSVLYVTIADFRGTDFSLSVRDKTLNTFHYKWEEASIDDVDPPFVESISKHFSGKIMKLSRKISEKKIQTKYPQTFLSNFQMNAPQFEPNFGKKPSFDEKTAYYSPNFVYENEEEEEKKDELIKNSLKENREIENLRKNKIKKENRETDKEDSEKEKEMKMEKELEKQKQKQKEMLNEKEKEKEGNKEKEEKISGEMEKKLILIKKKYELIINKPKENWTHTDQEFVKIASEKKMQSLLAKLK